MGLPSIRRTAAASMSACLVGLAVAGCARFDDTASTPFTTVPTFSAGGEVQPRQQAPTSSPSAGTTEPPRALAPCEDADPNVVATCLDTTGGLTMLPGAQSALVTERRTGRILRVAPGTAPEEVARLDVDGSGDGGLLSIALSPTYVEDNLLYAYVSTATDNRVVRLAPGDAPKAVLTGIPRGATGNAGALAFSAPNELMVLTGNAGNPGAATDPASLAGKLLRVTALTPDLPGGQPLPQIVLSGIGTAGGVCVDPHGGGVWVTDRTALEDRLQRVAPNGAAGVPVWTWPDRPGVAGCAAGPDAVAVSLTAGKALALVALDPHTGSATAAPALLAQNKYGQLGGAALGDKNQVWVSTVNKSGNEVGPTDDRVVKIPAPQGGGGFD
ncbi:oxidoreductase [Rhodococcus spelaei]|uniref:Oxidoreductase n=1 Tax=Rhodococcus spelaei TaxID=2546320 RepID=A0A541B4C6_9NOCA|nr:PQQ-dependent sugar dehydrogenase [Rhodococcus spelaei]TQF67173.1 oxidoreductase [Rhodococcus spelaei]